MDSNARHRHDHQRRLFMDKLMDEAPGGLVKGFGQWRNVALVLSTAACIGITLGLFPSLIAIGIEERGFDTAWNGMLAAMAPLAGIVVGPFVPRIMAALGALGTFVAFALMSAVGALLFPLFSDLYVWFGIRFAMGIGMGIQWVVSETWMNRVAVGPRRGMILSLYVIVLSAAIALGPYLLASIGTKGVIPFLMAAALLTLSALPLVFAGKGVGDETHATASLSLIASFRRAPGAMLTGLADGLVFQTMLVWLPLYFMKLGTPEISALHYLTLFCLGGVLLQFIVGYMLDRFPPPLVLSVSCGLLIMGLALTATVAADPVLAWPLLLAMGGCAAAIYTTGLAAINDAFRPNEMPNATAGFSMLWYVGGLGGPAAAGYAMDMWGPIGMPAVIAIACAAMVVTGVISLLKPAQLSGAAPHSADPASVPQSPDH
jgi:MFS family permease